MGITPLSKIEVVSVINIVNMARATFCYASTRPPKYNPRVYLGTINTSATIWSSDYTLNDQGSGSSLAWPESFGEKYNSPLIHQKSQQ